MPHFWRDFSVTIKNFKDAGVAIPITSPCNLTVWPMQKADGSQRMAVDYFKFN